MTRFLTEMWWLRTARASSCLFGLEENAMEEWDHAVQWGDL